MQKRKRERGCRKKRLAKSRKREGREKEVYERGREIEGMCKREKGE